MISNNLSSWFPVTPQSEEYVPLFREITGSQLNSIHHHVFTNTESYKVTVTFNRKFWKKSRAFKHFYPHLARLLKDADVVEGLFSVELHKDLFPHFHGVIRWASSFTTSPEYLRNKLVSAFGQSKIFKLDEAYFKDNQAEQKYADWSHYLTKDYELMKRFRLESGVSFPICIHYKPDVVEDSDSECD